MNTVFTVLAVMSFVYAIVIRIHAGMLRRVVVPWFFLAAMFFLLSVFWKLFPHWAKMGVIVLCVTGVVIYAAVAGSLIETIRESKKDRPMKYLIVLGAQVYGRRPCDALKRRLDGALERMSRHPDAVVIVSGGKGADEDFAEAEVMEEYLRKNGGNDLEIRVENRSANTYENLKFSAEIIGSLKEETGIVSNSWHLHRAVELAEKLGYTKAFPVYASSGKVTFFHYFSREVTAIFVQSLKSRRKRTEKDGQ